MIKEFITKIAGVVFLGTACDMLIPEGNLKKYYKLAMGFIVICVLTKPLVGFVEIPSFEFTDIETMSEEEILAQSDAYILKMHEDNIKSEIEKIVGENTEVYVRLYSDGRVKSVWLKGGNLVNEKIEEIKNLTGCEDITVMEDEY